MELEEEIAHKVAGGEHCLRKSADSKAQISSVGGERLTDLCFAICSFSQVVIMTSRNLTQNLSFSFSNSI